MSSVFDLLDQDGAGPTRVGGRHRCPKCEARTALAVKNDTFAYCFACGTKWDSTKAAAAGFWISTALARFAQDCFRAANGSSAQAAAWRDYLLNTRQVDGEVLASCPVGMIPVNYDAGDVRRLAEEGFRSSRTQLAANTTKKERQRVEAIIAREEEELTRFNQQLSSAVTCAGWLVFFYGDPGRFTSARLRNPAAKDFRLIRPISHRAGVFNPISPTDGYPANFIKMASSTPISDLTNEVLAFEGELNQLSLLSATARADRANGGEWQGGIPSCALGSAGDWDARALSDLTNEPVVFPDNDEAGTKAVITLAKTLKRPVLYSKMPNGTSDLDEFLRGVAAADVYPKLAGLLSIVRSHLRPIEDVREELNTLRRNEDKRDQRTYVEPEVVKTFWRDLVDRGEVYFDGTQVFYFHRRAREVYEVGRNPYWQAYMSEFGLLSEDKLSQQAIASTVQRGMREGTRVNVHRTAHFDSKTNTCYVNLGDHRVARITAAGITEASNGDDGVLFLNRTKEPFALDLTKLPAVTEGLRGGSTPLSNAFDAKFATEDTHLTSEACRQLILARLFNMLLSDEHSTKPLMVLKGERGSGKTTLASKVGWLLEGKDFRATGADPDPREMETKLVSTDLLVLDNVDDLSSREGGTLDVLCRSASSGEVTRRKLYSDANVNLNFKMTAHVWISTRTNPLDRPDLADRQILIPLARYGESDGKTESEIRAEFLAQRDELMGEVLVRLSHILASLEREKGNTYQTPFRMRDFAVFCLKVAHDEGWEAEMDAVLRSTVKDQVLTVSEGNSLVEILRLFIGYRAKRIQEGNWRLTASDLRLELITVMDRLKIACPWRSAEALAFALKREPTLYRDLGLDRELDRRTKTNRYIFKPTPETLDAAKNEWGSRFTEPWNLDEVP